MTLLDELNAGIADVARSYELRYGYFPPVYSIYMQPDTLCALLADRAERDLIRVYDAPLGAEKHIMYGPYECCLTGAAAPRAITALLGEGGRCGAVTVYVPASKETEIKPREDPDQITEEEFLSVLRHQ